MVTLVVRLEDVLAVTLRTSPVIVPLPVIAPAARLSVILPVPALIVPRALKLPEARFIVIAPLVVITFAKPMESELFSRTVSEFPAPPIVATS